MIVAMLISAQAMRLIAEPLNAPLEDTGRRFVTIEACRKIGHGEAMRAGDAKHVWTCKSLPGMI